MEQTSSKNRLGYVLKLSLIILLIIGIGFYIGYNGSRFFMKRHTRSRLQGGCISCLDTLLPKYGKRLSIDEIKRTKGKLYLIAFWDAKLKNHSILSNYDLIYKMFKDKGLNMFVFLKEKSSLKFNLGVSFPITYDSIMVKRFYVDRDKRLLPVYILDSTGKVVFREPFPISINILNQIIQQNLYGEINRRGEIPFKENEALPSAYLSDESNLKDIKDGVITFFSPAIIRCKKCEEYKRFKVLKGIKNAKNHNIYFIITYNIGNERLKNFIKKENLNSNFNCYYTGELPVLSLNPKMLPLTLVVKDGKIAKIIDSEIDETEFRKIAKEEKW